MIEFYRKFGSKILLFFFKTFFTPFNHLLISFFIFFFFSLQPIIYPTHTLLGSNGLIPFTGAGTTLSPSAAAQAAHYTTAYDLSQFGATAAQLDLQNAANASFPYSSNALNTVNALNLALNQQLAAAASNNQLAASNASQQLANANSYYAALANAQAISATGAQSLAGAYQQ